MNTQIEQLRRQFNGYNNAQKKQFIDKLRQKLQGQNNPEFSKFLNECVANYNASLRGGASSNDDFSDLLDNRHTNTSTKNYVLAEPAKRLIAFFLDILLIFLVLYLPIAIFLSLIAPLAMVVGEGIGLLVPFVIIGVVVVLIIIEVKYWKKSTSFGKNIMKITVVHKDTGKPMSTGNMFLRETFGRLISGMLFLFGYIWILIDKDKQAFHDKLVSSVVVNR